jgi:large subunit ribosomal protein L23
MKSPYDVIMTRVVTERSTHQEENTDCPKYTFTVAAGANKNDIRRAVQDVFKVNVLSVNTLIVRGKLRRLRARQGRSSSWKKAIVTLESGQRIDFA